MEFDSAAVYIYFFVKRRKEIIGIIETLFRINNDFANLSFWHGFEPLAKQTLL